MQNRKRIRVEEMDYLGERIQFEADIESELKKQYADRNMNHPKSCCSYEEGKCRDYPRLSALNFLTKKAEQNNISLSAIEMEMNGILTFKVRKDNEKKDAEELKSSNYEKGTASVIKRFITWEDFFEAKKPKAICLWDYAQAIIYLINDCQLNQNPNRKGGTIRSFIQNNANLSYERSRKYKVNNAAKSVVKKYETNILGENNLMFTDEQREEIAFQFEKHKYYSIQLILKRLESARSAGYDSETLDYLFRSELNRAVMIDQAEPENAGHWQNWLDAFSFRT